MKGNTLLAVVFFLTLSVAMTGGVRAQSLPNSTLTFFAGVALPTGDYGALSGDKAGFATTGFGGGIDFTSRIINGFQLGLSGGLAVNSVDQDFIRRLLTNVPVGVQMGTWFEFHFVACAGYAIDVTPFLALYGRGYGGLIIATSPSIQYNLPGDYTNYIREDPATAAAPGYGIGFGAMIVRSVDVGFRFLTAEPEFKTMLSDQSTSVPVKLKQSMQIIELTVGYQIL